MKKTNLKRAFALFLAVLICVSMTGLNASAWTIEAGTLNCHEHVHNDDCLKEMELKVCELEEHTHDAECYETQRSQILACEIAEEDHEHTDDCYTYLEDATLVCPEAEHTHTDDCQGEVWTGNYQCEDPESEHKHTAGCYKQNDNVGTHIQNALDGNATEGNGVTKDDDDNTITVILNGQKIELHSGVIVVNGKTLVIQDGEVVGGSLDLGGKSGSVITVENGGTLELEGGTITGGTGSEYKEDLKWTTNNGNTVHIGETDTEIVGGGVFVNGGTFEMSGGTITENGGTSTDLGGGVFVSGGTFEMTGGTISNNTVKTDVNVQDTRDASKTSMGNGTAKNSGQGGGVYVTNGGTFTMGTAGVDDDDEILISGNKASEGAGIFIDGGFNEKRENGDAGQKEEATFIMNGGTVDSNIAYKGEAGGIYIQGTGTIKEGTISNNQTHTKNDLGGGGIYVEKDGTLYLTNASITNNTAAGLGGGIACCAHGISKIFAENGAAIYDNTAEGNAHVNLRDGKEHKTNWPKGGIDADLIDGYNTWKDWDDTFKASANDLFTAGNSDEGMTSVIGNNMLGGGTSNWKGYQATTGNKESITEVDASKGQIAHNSLLALSANASEAAKAMAEAAAKVHIFGNTSATHGGGIGNNGTIVIGEHSTTTNVLSKAPEINIQKVYETVYKTENGETLATKEEELKEGQFSFELYGGNGQLIDKATVKNDAKGKASIVIPTDSFVLDQGKTEQVFYFYVKEKNDGQANVNYSETIYRIKVTVTTSEETATMGTSTYTTKTVKVKSTEVEELGAADGVFKAIGAAVTVAQFRNECALGSLTVTKSVINDKDYPADLSGKIYSFTVTGPDGYSESFTLANGDSKTLTDLKEGTYTVSEDDGDSDIKDYDLEVSGTGDYAVGKGKAVTATVTNTYTRHMGELAVDKSYSVDSETEYSNEVLSTKVFSFTAYGPLDIKGEEPQEYHFKVTGEGTSDPQTVPTGKYSITEDNADIDTTKYAWAISEDSDSEVTVTYKGSVEAKVINLYDRKYGDLTVFKEVIGPLNEAERNRVFRFTVEGPIEPKFAAEWKENWADPDYLEVPADGSATLEHLPTGTYIVREKLDEANLPGYSFNAVDDGVSVVLVNENGGETTITNIYSEIPEDPEEPEEPKPEEPNEPEEPDEPVDEPDVPLDPGPEDPGEPEEPVDEPDVPLAPAPVEEVPDENIPLIPAEPEEEIVDENIPLAAVPKTGDTNGVWGMISFLSASALVCLLATSRKKEEN